MASIGGPRAVRFSSVTRAAGPKAAERGRSRKLCCPLSRRSSSLPRARAGLAAAAALLAASAAVPAHAAWEPAKPVEFVVPAGTGGGADQMARFIQGVVTKHSLMKPPRVVVNKAGAAGAEIVDHSTNRSPTLGLPPDQRSEVAMTAPVHRGLLTCLLLTMLPACPGSNDTRSRPQVVAPQPAAQDLVAVPRRMAGVHGSGGSSTWRRLPTRSAVWWTWHKDVGQCGRAR